jgi:NodT family efflux transporter outer membrane factor (OMF) lipoprotein
MGKRVRCFLASWVLGALGACTVGPRYERPTAWSPAAFKEEWPVAHPQDTALRGNWWELFGEPELDELEAQLLRNNQSIKQTFENLMAARAQVQEARAQYFPVVSAAPAASGSRYSATGSYNGPTGAIGPLGGTVPLYSIPVDLSWEIDLWGKVRNAVRQVESLAQMSAADLENEKLTEEASLAQYYFELRGQDALIKILSDTVEADERSLQLTRAQYETGTGTEIAVVEAENTLETARAGAAGLGIARAQYEHAIATLMGRPASELALPVRSVLSAPPPIPLGLPSQLLERRPDIAAAERGMAAANAQIGVAEAAYFPSLSLTLSGGLESMSLKTLFELPSRVWSVGASLSETIFDAGLRRATVQQYVAAFNAQVASYRATVLTAFQQVEDSLASLRIVSEELEHQRRAVDLADRSLKLEMVRYQTGIDPYIDVVLAQNTLLAAQQTLAQLQIQDMTASVQLIQALGGGWNANVR